MVTGVVNRPKQYGLTRLRMGAIVLVGTAIAGTYRHAKNIPDVVMTSLGSSIPPRQLTQDQPLPNSENKIELQYNRPIQVPQRSPFTLDEFTVNGVNLAAYGYEAGNATTIVGTTMDKPYLLFEDFNIANNLGGLESWEQMVDYHRKLKNPSLSFYYDKVASKRWMKAMAIPIPDTMALMYKHELDDKVKEAHQGRKGRKGKFNLYKKEKAAIAKLLPTKQSFVAKPTNRACSSGVWIVNHDHEQDKTLMGYGGKPVDTQYEPDWILNRLVKDINRRDDNCGNWVMQQVEPGFLLEDRFTAAAFDGGDNHTTTTATSAAVEFKVFTIWGRVWLAEWRQGKFRPGLVDRNGTIVDWAGKDATELPHWVKPHWAQVIEIAERMSRHKDMYRIDMFVGVPAETDHPGLQKGATNSQQIEAVEVRVSETEFAPTTRFQQDPRLLEEASRLLMAGYKMGITKVIHNDEVPRAFLEKGFLSEEDAQELHHGEFWELSKEQ